MIVCFHQVTVVETVVEVDNNDQERVRESEDNEPVVVESDENGTSGDIAVGQGPEESEGELDESEDIVENDQASEYDSSESDNDESSEVADDSEDWGGPVARETIFLVGGRSRFGRSVRFNKKFI